MNYSTFITKARLACTTGVLALSLAAGVAAGDQANFNIQPQPLSEALIAFYQQSGKTVMVAEELVAGKTAPAVRGNMAPEQALAVMLAGTGLDYQAGADGSITIFHSTASDSMSSSSNNEENVSFVLEEIIVTAEKRAESLQDVPVAITAYSSEGLKARGLSTPQDLQFATPGLSIGEDHTGGTANVSVRGIATENYQAGGDPGVPIHINGHYTQSTAYIFRDFIDVERVEVLRGPQGTLYGRNAVGGNINLITKRPTEDFEGEVGAALGNYDRRLLTGVVSGPLAEGLRGRFVAASGKRDGYVENLGAGDDLNTEDYISLRGSLEYDFSENFEAYLNAYYFKDTGTSFTRRLDANPNNISNTEIRKAAVNLPSQDLDESIGASLDLSWDLGGVIIRSLSAYDDTQKNSIYDIDATTLQREAFFFDIGYTVFTQELQVVSDHDGPLQWVTGLYYYNEESETHFNIILDRFDTDENGLTGIDGDSDQPLLYLETFMPIKSRSYAAYGQVDYSLTDQLELVAGLRYTRDEKERLSRSERSLSNGGSVALFGGGFLVPLTTVRFDNTGDNGASWEKVTWKAGLNYHINDDAMVYASYSRGYKAGGYNTDNVVAYNPEVVDAFELGLKGLWLDNRLRTNLSAFYYDYSDKQEFVRKPPSAEFPNGSFAIENAATVKVKGFELETSAFLTDALTVDINIAYLSSEYDQYFSEDAIFNPGVLADLSGNKSSLAPEWSIYVGVGYILPVFSDYGQFTLRGDLSWKDKQYSSPYNRTPQPDLLGNADLIPSYTLANARLQWESRDTTVQVELFVRNITDEDIISNSYLAQAAEQFETYLAPRTYGISVGYRF